MAITRRSAVFLWIAAAAGAALHVCAALGTPVGAASDDALHLLLARNLLSGGFALPDAAGVPATQPLPGFALLMALPVRLLSPHWALLRGAALLATLALAVWSFRLCRRLSGEAAGWAAVLLVAANPVLAAWAGVALPDIPFAAASAGAFLLLARDEPPLPGLIAVAALAAVLRPQGAVLAAALAAGVGFRGGPRRAAAVLAGALAPLSLWLLRGHLLTGSATSYLDDWRRLQALGDTSLPFRAATLAAGLGRGFFGELSPLAALLGLALAAAAAVSGALRLWRTRSPGARAVVLSAAVYGTGLAALHAGWRAWDSRYVLPFLAPALPLWAAAFAGLYERKRETALAVLLLAAAPGLWDAANAAAAGVQSPRAELYPAAAAWIRANVPAGGAVISTEPFLFALTTGRRAYYPPAAATRELWIAALRSSGVRCVVVHRQAAPPALVAPEARTPLTDFDDWAVPSPPLTLGEADDAEDLLLLRLE
ncbi:MAG TPA: hypothetical protein VN915_11910 [Elusimicrobiota bacterium]|nr:hypothetical protein [Elusimicrobiota bacterium]